ncbi:porin [Moraxella marmotae]|uniref:porin n=1 Tax=Moraxella marmotae TaxID=3344520 RepID=UPI0035F4986B
MKKLVLATAIAALSVTAAQAAPTVYGKAFLTLDAVDGNDNSSFKDSRTQLNSNASRIGLKGSEALTANTDLVYKLEYRVDIDADTQQFKSRDTYLGLSNKTYGTLLAGRLTAIDDFVNYANVTEGGVLGGDNVLASFDAPRANNTFAYVSPKYNGLTASAMYVLDENNATDNLGRDAFGVAVQYEPEAAYRAGASYIQAGDTKAIRVSGSYDVTPAATVGALYQNTAFPGANTKKENAFTVSGTYKVAQTPWTAYGQVDVVDNVAGDKDEDLQRLVLGGKYAFNKQTTGHLYSAYLRNDDGHDTDNAYGIGGGLEYKF